MSINKLSARIKGGLQFTGVHAEVTAWIKQNPGSYFDKRLGVSHINGKNYYNEVAFISEEDKVAFLLRFGNLVYA